MIEITYIWCGSPTEGTGRAEVDEEVIHYTD